MSRSTRIAGFTLIETVVAFAIAATSLALLFRINAGSTATVSLADEYVQATALARSLLAEHATTERSLSFTRSGIELDKYRWRVSSQLLREIDPANGPPLFALREITVEVEWQSRDRLRRIELSSASPRFADRNP